jgi:hypothetical protein
MESGDLDAKTIIEIILEEEELETLANDRNPE